MKYGLYLIALLFFVGCKEDDQNSLAVSREEITIESDGGESSFIIQTDASEWRIQNLTDWISIDPTIGTESSSTITVTVNSKSIEERSEVLTIIAGSAESIGVTVTQASSDYLYDISSNYDAISFKQGGSSNEIEVTTDAPEWVISSEVDWLQFSPVTGGSGTTKVVVTAVENSNSEVREASIAVSAEYAVDYELDADQFGDYYPDYNTDPIAPDETGMTSTATELAANMTLGWNIGNTLEAIGGETAWGNPKVTDDLIKAVKANGFNAIRIPCSWDQNLESQTSAKIKESWLNRVKEVIQYCVDNDMYVVLNIHWDGGWLENNVSPAKEEENNAKQKALWQQIATHLRGFDEHLLFASANEPNVENATQMAVLDYYHQTFIDAVRATGGKNAHRVLVVQGPSTDVEKTNELWKTLPTDNIDNKMMAEVHFYTPYNFCLMETDQSWGDMFYYWGEGYHSTTDTDRNATWGEESTVDELMGLMKAQFVDKGIPVILGEFGAVRRTSLTGDELELHLASRAYYLKYVTNQSISNGLIPFYWDAGGLGDLSGGIFNRSNNTVFDQQALDAMVEGASGE
ncbi:MAG: cellulase family glycosylhydrolase [Reichenbachiella sp.]